ncbi:MAG: sulfurtransferase-like selenium metabolism protein YedF [Blautia sp.]|nr:sulfurtransferase-like selenium metabolism protein YedF [Blautia sp.]
MKYEVNAMGKQCPIPVVMTKEMIDKSAVGDEIQVFVDNETAVNNLSKLAAKKGCSFVSQKLEEKKYQVDMKVQEKKDTAESTQEQIICDSHKKVTVAVISSNTMGNGDDELGKILIKGFIYALSQMETHPDTIIFYNGGARLTTQGSESLEDLKNLEKAGTEILTCGTCLKHYDLMDKLAVGKVTDMYTIAEKMTGADKIIRP